MWASGDLHASMTRPRSEWPWSIVLFSGGCTAVYIWPGNGGLGSMDSEKKRAPWVPALVVPPDPLAPLEEWQSYRADLDALETRLLVSHPDLDWLDGIRAFKAEADAVIRQMTRRGR